VACFNPRTRVGRDELRFDRGDFGVPAGGGMLFEFVSDLVGEFPFGNHAFGHGQNGATGLLIVEP